MKSKRNLLEQLKNLPFFNKKAFFELADQLGLKKTTINTYVSRFLKRKEILALKNGLYVSGEFFDKNKGDISYLFYLANVLRKPSYISSWTALQYYNLTTEVIRSYTSVSLKVTRDYETKAGTFSYQSIKKDFFSGYSLVEGKFSFFIASPSKALFDLLYFKTRQFRGVERSEIPKMVNALRIDFEEMEDSEQKKFYDMIEAHIHE
jgi:predicted transcriptional regulator of viral defense system